MTILKFDAFAQLLHNASVLKFPNGPFGRCLEAMPKLGPNAAVARPIVDLNGFIGTPGDVPQLGYGMHKHARTHAHVPFALVHTPSALACPGVTPALNSHRPGARGHMQVVPSPAQCRVSMRARLADSHARTLDRRMRSHIRAHKTRHTTHGIHANARMCALTHRRRYRVPRASSTCRRFHMQG